MTMEDDEIKKSIDGIKWFHTIKIGNYITPGESQEWQDYLAHAIPLNLNGKAVLDIGCWDGYFSFLCEQRGAFRVVGIDDKYLDGAMLAKRLLNSNVEFRKQSLYDFEGEQFDVVIFFGVYYHAPDLIRIFEKACEAARDLLLIEGDVYPAFGNMPLIRDIIPNIVAMEPSLTPRPNNWYWRPSFRAIKSILKKFGFEKVEVVSTYGKYRMLLRCRRSSSAVKE